MKKVMLFLAVAVLAVSCNSFDENKPNAGTLDEMPQTFHASVDDATRAGFTYDGVDTYNHYWSVNDQVYLYHNSTRATYKIADAADATNGVFTKVADSDVSISPRSFTNWCAVFNSTNTSAPSVTADNTLGNVKQGGFYTTSAAPNGYANIMVANCNDAELTHLDFKNVVGWLKLQLKGYKSVKRIEVFRNDNANISGSYSVTFAANESISISALSGDTDEIDANFSPAVALSLSTPTDFYVAMPEMEIDGGIYVNVVYSDDTNQIISTTNTVTIDRNKVTPMAARFVENFTDLSGNAMTFIVSSAGHYKFYAKTPDVSRALWDTSPITTSATVLWETDNTTTPVSAGDIITVLGHDDHYVYFKTASPFKEGNALIQTNNHCYLIWCTDAPSEITLDSGQTPNVIILDRNLGALSANPSDGILAQGLYFQLFRPVPFPGNHASTGSITTAAPAGSWATAKNNPTVFYAKTASEKSWLSTVNGLRTIYNHWFPSSSSLTRGVYDPCPAGYRLMTTPVETTSASATGGVTITKTNSSYFPNGYITATGTYSSALCFWFNHHYNATYIYVSNASGSGITPSYNADEFSGYQLRCQKHN